MFTSKQIFEKVNCAVENLSLLREPQSLYEPIRYALSIGGKRVRSVLMLMGYNLYRDDVDSVLSSALAIETYHNYTLLHDDLMDESDLRRGFPTVHRRWNANKAILSGDSMLVLAFQMLQQNKKNLNDVLDCFTETALEIGEGQEYDMMYEIRDDVTETEYIEMIRLKTSVLLACSLKIGALLADAPLEDIENLYHFGEKIGLAYQLQDDWLDVYGDERVFRKNLGGDIVSNKKTYMLINAFLRADVRQRKELQYWCSLREFDRHDKITAVTRLYDEMGIGKMSENKINDYFCQAQKYLDAVNVDDDRKNMLRQYTAELMNRKY
ncbi:MAG: polyprenyl synthetase family protein [Prevotella sp.]|nr:polyprenyl synthetase family protein [Candidatus Equicola faecalis]